MSASASAAARRPTALITGASSGIGYELAKQFARDGYQLVIVATNVQRLHEVAAELTSAYGVAVKVLPKDLSRPESADDIYQELQREAIQVDVLVNNAGYAMHGRFDATDCKTELQMMHVNMVALTQLTKLLLPSMLTRKHGKILNVASTAAFQPGPFMAVYYATKAYVLSFSEALAEELHGTGVTVTALCPGITRTGFQARAGIQRTHLVRSGMMSPASVADAGYRGLMRGRIVVIPGLKNQLTAVAVRMIPRSLVRRAVRVLQERAE